MKKFNFDKILLCFGIFFVSVFGVGMIDSHAATISEDEFNSISDKYIVTRKYKYNNGPDYEIVEIYGCDKPFYLPDDYTSISNTDKGKFYFLDSNGNHITLNRYRKEYEIQPNPTYNSTHYYQYETDYWQNQTLYLENNGPQHLFTFDKYIVSSNFDLKTLSGKMVFQNNPLKEVKQVGEAVKNQTKVILPIAIFLMGCLILVQILRRVLTRYSVS